MTIIRTIMIIILTFPFSRLLSSLAIVSRLGVPVGGGWVARGPDGRVVGGRLVVGGLVGADGLLV